MKCATKGPFAARNDGLDAPKLPAKEGLGAPRADRGPTILTVDDHDVLRAALKSCIAFHYPEARLLEAVTGEEALALVGAHFPDVVLMDISLPRMNGIEATAKIKAIDPDAKLVIVTTHDTSDHRRDAAAAGACAYVVKDRLGVELFPLLDRLLGYSDLETEKGASSNARTER